MTNEKQNENERCSKCGSENLETHASLTVVETRCRNCGNTWRD